MIERPILMSGAMVRATLREVDPKTQTRRVMKPTPEMVTDKRIVTWDGDPSSLMRLLDKVGRTCPYGQSGDRLWVRETWKTTLHSPGYDNGLQESGGIDSEPGVATIAYAAGGEMVTVDFLEAHEDDQAARALAKWKPSIHMPRWASRILLEIVSVRVERLNDISESDAQAEGITTTGDGAYHVEDDRFRAPTAKESYARLWESINGTGSWDANPWVWVIEFKVVKP